MTTDQWELLIADVCLIILALRALGGWFPR